MFGRLRTNHTIVDVSKHIWTFSDILGRSKKTNGTSKYIPNKISGGRILKEFFAKNSSCVAVAAAAGALRVTGLGTAATGPPPRWRRLQKIDIFVNQYFFSSESFCPKSGEKKRNRP